MKDQLELIIKIANHLDLHGHHHLADKLDKGCEQMMDLTDGGHSSYMAKPQLADIHEMAAELYNSIPEGAELPDWCESKIAVISAYLNDIHRSIKSKMHGFNIQE